MMFFKSTFVLPALLTLASALSKHHVPTSQMSVVVSEDIVGAGNLPTFATAKSDCDADSEADCKEFCGLSEQQATCAADGNKVTCYCKGGKSGGSNCEERCLLCMPDKDALAEASRLFKLGGSKVEL